MPFISRKNLKDRLDESFRLGRLEGVNAGREQSLALVADALNLEKYILERNPVYGDYVDTGELREDLKRIVKARNAREEKANAKKLLANAEKSLRLGNDV